jgi:hypothetical protein
VFQSPAADGQDFCLPQQPQKRHRCFDLIGMNFLRRRAGINSIPVTAQVWEPLLRDRERLFGRHLRRNRARDSSQHLKDLC